MDPIKKPGFLVDTYIKRKGSINSFPAEDFTKTLSAKQVLNSAIFSQWPR
jgi:hypothetical protein